MKRKFLVLAPLFALTLTGCFARIPLPARSDQTTKTSSSSSTSEPEEETYGTMEAPITCARAIELAKAAYSDLKVTSFVDKDAYVKGIVKTAPRESTKEENKGTYEFKIGDSYESNDYVDFYYGKADEGVELPVEGDEVILFGRLATYDAGEKVEFVANAEEGIDIPLVKKSEHVSYALTLSKTGEATVTGLPATAKSGDKVEFTVAPGASYDIDEVLINGVYDYAPDNKYSFTVTHATTVTVTAVKDLVKSKVRIAFEAGLQLEQGAATTDKYTFDGTVVAMVGNSFFIQDGKYGMYVYNKATAGIAIGKKVEVEATIQNYSGVIETKAVSSSTVTGIGTLPTVGSITSLTSLANLRQNVLSEAKGVKFVSKDKDWASNQNSIAKFDLNGETLTVKFDKYGYNKENGDVINAAKEGDTLNLLSTVTTVNYGTPQLIFAGTSSFTKSIEPLVGPTSVTVSPTTKEMHVGDHATLTATVLPDNTSDKSVEWTSDHPEIATVDKATGEVEAKAISATKATITATSKLDPTVKGSCEITVSPIAVTSVTVSPKAMPLAVGGATGTITATVEPDNATDKSLTWSVQSGADFIQLNEGVVTPVAEGTAVVRAASVSNPDKYDECTVTVSTTTVHVTSVSVDPTSKTVKIGESFTITPTVLPEEATNKNVTWESSDSSKASVENGVVTANAVTGNTPVTITATSVDNPEKSATCTVTVEPIVAESVTVSPATKAMVIGDTTTLTAEVLPANTTDKTVTWSSSDATAVSVNSETGAIEALKATTDPVTITATSNSNPNAKGTCSVTVTAQPAESGMKTAYETAVALAKGASTTETYTFTGVVTSITKGSFTVQDGDYAMYVYNSTLPTGVAVGKEVETTALLKNYNGLPETTGTATVTVKGDGTAVTPATIGSQADLNALNINMLANINEATYKSKNKDWTSSQSAQFVYTIGGNDITVSYDKNGYDATKAAIVNGAAEGDKFKFTNITVGCYNSKQIAFAGTSTIEDLTPVVVPTDIEFKSGTYEVTIGGTGLDMSKNVVLTPSNAKTTITYSIKENAVGVSVSEEGVVTATTAASAGTVTLVATTANSLSAQVSITVKASTPTTQSYKLVTSVANLAAGDRIVIANAAMDIGMKAYASGNNIPGGAITVANNEITSLGDAVELTLEDAGDGKFYIKMGDTGYLYAASSSANQLKVKTSKDSSNGVWEFTYSNGVMGIVASGSSNRNVMRYNPNNGNPIFNCYGASSTTGTLMQVFKYS